MTELENIANELDSIEKRVGTEINVAAVAKVAEFEKEITQLKNVVAQIEPIALNLVKNMQEAKTIIEGLNEKILTMKASVAPAKIEIIEEPIGEIKVG